MTTTQHPTDTVPIQNPAASWSRGSRIAAATCLVGGSAMWAAASFVGAGHEGADRLAWEVANPVPAGLGLIADAVGSMLLLGAFLTWFLLSRPRSPKLAWTGGVLLGIALSMQGIVSGIEMSQFALARSGSIPLDRLDEVLQSVDYLGLPGMVLLPLWLVTPLVGIIVSMIALWRSRTVARAAIVLVLAFQVLEIARLPIPGDTLLFFAGLTWMAYSVLTLRPTSRPQAPRR